MKINNPKLTEKVLLTIKLLLKVTKFGEEN